MGLTSTRLHLLNITGKTLHSIFDSVQNIRTTHPSIILRDRTCPYLAGKGLTSYEAPSLKLYTITSTIPARLFPELSGQAATPSAMLRVTAGILVQQTSAVILRIEAGRQVLFCILYPKGRSELFSSVTTFMLDIVRACAPDDCREHIISSCISYKLSHHGFNTTA